MANRRLELLLLAAADIALMLRAVREERTLALDEAYRAYMQQRPLADHSRRVLTLSRGLQPG